VSLVRLLVLLFDEYQRHENMTFGKFQIKQIMVKLHQFPHQNWFEFIKKNEYNLKPWKTIKFCTFNK